MEDKAFTALTILLLSSAINSSHNGSEQYIPSTAGFVLLALIFVSQGFKELPNVSPFPFYYFYIGKSAILYFCFSVKYATFLKNSATTL